MGGCSSSFLVMWCRAARLVQADGQQTLSGVDSHELSCRHPLSFRFRNLKGEQASRATIFKRPLMRGMRHHGRGDTPRTARRNGEMAGV